MNEIRYTLVRYKTELGTEIGIVITDVLIDCMGNIVIDYYDLQSLDYLVAGNRYTDVGMQILPIICMAWQRYLEWENSQPPIPNIYKN